VCIHSICMMLDEIYKDRKEKVIDAMIDLRI
jgi:hypothetical protein